MEYTVTGEFREKRGQRKFSKSVQAETPKRAVEKAVSLIASEHAKKKRHIKITSTEEVKQNAGKRNEDIGPAARANA